MGPPALWSHSSPQSATRRLGISTVALRTDLNPNRNHSGVFYPLSSDQRRQIRKTPVPFSISDAEVPWIASSFSGARVRSVSQ